MRSPKTLVRHLITPPLSDDSMLYPLLGRVMQINLSDGWQALFPPSHPLSQGARGTFPALSRRERGAGGRVRALMALRGGACGLICITRLGGVAEGRGGFSSR